MSVLYRAVWSDTVPSDPVQAVEDLKTCIARWTQEASDPAPLVEGRTEFEVSKDRRREVLHRRIAEEAFEVTVTDNVPGDATDWATVIQIVMNDDGVHILVELSMSSDDLARRVSVGRPKVVHDLLQAAEKPQLGGSGLVSGPLEIPPNGIAILTEMLAEPTRSLPLIVCAEPTGEHDETWLRVAYRIATRTEGIATVITLGCDAVAAFRQEFGFLGIWDGGVRVYAPGVVTMDSEGWRHRYYLRSRIEGSPTATVDRIVYAAAQLSTRRRVPDVFRVFGEKSGLPADALDGMIPADELTNARQQWALDLEDARDEQSSLERELASSNGHLARLKKALIEHHLIDLLWGTQHEEAASIQDEVQDTSEAALAAQMYLSEWLSLPDTAIRELDDIDTAPEAYNWGNKTWRGLRALAAYAEDRAGSWDNGGFWEWCAAGRLLAWPATSKKLSMTESDTVQNVDKLSRTRIFPIDPAVHPSGEIMMLAHLKISEGGGNLAPRVYFHDDTSGSTGRIHVGLIGPHYLVPNKSTN